MCERNKCNMVKKNFNAQLANQCTLNLLPIQKTGS